jgi:8-oxo-dGTP diphosphatase
LQLATNKDKFMSNTLHTPTSKHYPMPFTRIELIIMSVVNSGLVVLLGKREQAPYEEQWALPGGVVRIDLDANLDESAQRVARERLTIRMPYLRQQCVVGGAMRDPRAPWAVSIVYRALTRAEDFNPAAGKRLDALRWCPVDEAIANNQLAFDHQQLIEQAVIATRSEIDRLDLPFGFLPEQFTLGELQTACEIMLGHRLDKSSFRRRIDERAIIEPVEGEMRIGAFRPAQLFRKCEQA